ncbi:tail fiber protein [Flagellimonas pacifica]|uniref:BZIP transcription factor n=1 Tax=Flagellimonas pacifica TaxID=1247520 RepID=A0A285MV41_9FLAO|nr:tail fiber protein [Allomuricauda parva]SNY99676.1 hypothetical protein SAMN06265377_1487 [Allomuricauda parva]
MKRKTLILFLMIPMITIGQTNNFPTNGNATINDGDLIQTGTSNDMFTQGALKLKNYLLFDSDGDFTGNNYYTIQDDPSGNYLRLGYGFASDMVINSSGNIGIGTTTPGAKLDINENFTFLRGTEKLYWGSKHVGSTDHRNYLAPRLADNSGWDWSQEFGYHAYNRSWYFSGNLGIGTSNPSAFFEVRKSINNSWTAKIYNGGGDGQGLLVQSGYGGSQSTNNPTILRLEDGGGNVRMKVQSNGKVGIGTESPDSKLTVKGKIHAEEVKVDLSVPGPDYVFKEDYDLKSLEEVQNYIKAHGHLPNIPSAKEMEANGIQLGEMDMKLLEKIEELTLYTLEQEKKLIRQQQQLEELNALKKRIEKIEKLLKQ